MNMFSGYWQNMFIFYTLDGNKLHKWENRERQFSVVWFLEKRLDTLVQYAPFATVLITKTSWEEDEGWEGGLERKGRRELGQGQEIKMGGRKG